MLIRYSWVVIVVALLSGCKASTVSPNVNDFAQSILSDMVPIRGGSYDMGDFGKKIHGVYFLENEDVHHLHKVTLDNFKLAAHRTTWAQYDQYAKFAGVETTRVRQDNENELTTVNRNEPIMAASVRWEDAKAYCQWVGKVTGEFVDLPTEAQWEYAARNRGQYVEFATDNGLYEEGLNVPEPLYSVPVGQYPPNPLGLYDMVSLDVDWMNDWYDEDYYHYSSENNPVGPKLGELKVVRNFSSFHFIDKFTITRGHDHPSTHFIPERRTKKETSAGNGFRCAVHSQPLPEPTDEPPTALNNDIQEQHTLLKNL